MDNQKELRYVNAELRAGEGDSREISGTAIVFNSESQLLGGTFREIIQPEAISDDLLKGDIGLYYNHDQNAGILARSKNGKGSLKIWKDERGVHFSFNAKRTSLGEEILQSVRNGDLESCSFGFIFEPGKGYDKWEKRSDGTYLRTVNRISNLFDFSIVINPAYKATDVYTRDLDELKEAELKEIQRLEEIRQYYKTLNEELDRYKK
jgi:HK97 family phage prohead protease